MKRQIPQQRITQQSKKDWRKELGKTMTRYRTKDLANFGSKKREIFADPEIYTIQNVLNLLTPLDYAERSRVICYAKAWADDPARQPAK